ncbi:MAG TPA: winged helix-turn-helix transcriptional regulator [Candidatus Thermoplasmatota archaeon]|nr:winged helix-turn-helix transcriptional regulator [Candidatus Thermoplasmatota archaeon]
MRAGGVVGAVTLMLLVLPVVGAAPAEAELRVLAPMHLAGSVGLAAPEGFVELPALQRIDGTAALLNITLTRHAPATTHARAAASDPIAVVPPEAEGLLPFGHDEPEIQFLEVAAPQALVFTTWQAAARAVMAVGPFDQGRLTLAGQAAEVRETDGPDAGELPATFARRSPTAWLAAEGAGALQASGSVRALFEGVGIVVQNATTVLTLDTTRARDGAGWVAEVRFTDALLDARADDAFAVRAPAMSFRVDGTLHGLQAWGDVRVDDGGQAVEGRPVEARGLLVGEMRPGGGAVRVRAAGDLASLTLGDRQQDFARAAAAGAGLALLSALAYYGQHLRFLALPLYARIAPNELMDNEVRRKVHAHVLAHPGADVKGTAEAVGVSWSTAAYHLARLQREGLVLARRSGRSKRFFVNGHGASARADAIAALRNPTALAIAELVARQPGLMQKEIGAALALPASTVSWHMRRLRALGVVAEQRRWRRAEYAPGEAWPELAVTMRGAAPVMAAAQAHLPPTTGAGSGVPAP